MLAAPLTEADRVGREREVLLKLHGLASTARGALLTDQAAASIYGLAAQVDDVILRRMRVLGQAGSDEFLDRVGYLLRTPNPADRMENGHKNQNPWAQG